jgi:hypothetical protein
MLHFFVIKIVNSLNCEHFYKVDVWLRRKLGKIGD